MSKEKFTWGDLKEFVNSLPEYQLQDEVIWWGDDRGGKIKNAELLEEDYISVGEGMEPKSDYQIIYKNEEEAEKTFIHYEENEISEDEIEAELPKGTPILEVD